MKHKVGVVGIGFVGTAVVTGLETLLGDSIDIREHDKYKDTESLDSVVDSSNIIFLCLPTPMDQDTGACDTSIIKDVIKNINKIAKTRKILVIKSTVPPGTTDLFQHNYEKHTFVFNPEFLTEATFIQDFLEQDRIVVGCKDKSKILPLIKLYEDFAAKQKVPAKIVYSDTTTCEMVKYTANCFLATKVTFFNEIWQICQSADIDYNKMMEICLLDKRIGNSHWKVPNNGDFGFGGSCFPKDMNALINFCENLGIDPMVLQTIWTKNLLVRQRYDWEKLAQVTGEYKKE